MTGEQAINELNDIKKLLDAANSRIAGMMEEIDPQGGEMRRHVPTKDYAEFLVNTACEYFGIERDELPVSPEDRKHAYRKAKNTGVYITKARRFIGKLLDERTPFTSTVIGDILGVSHSTILGYISDMEEVLQSKGAYNKEKDYRDYLAMIKYIYGKES